MTRYTELDRVARQWPLGTCVKSNHPHDPIYGRVIGWRLSISLVYVDVVCVPGHHPRHLLPEHIRAISPSAMPDYAKAQY